MGYQMRLDILWVTLKISSDENVDVDFHEYLKDKEIWNEHMEEDQFSLCSTMFEVKLTFKCWFH